MGGKNDQTRMVTAIVAEANMTGTIVSGKNTQLLNRTIFSKVLPSPSLIFLSRVPTQEEPQRRRQMHFQSRRNLSQNNAQHKYKTLAIYSIYETRSVISTKSTGVILSKPEKIENKILFIS